MMLRFKKIIIVGIIMVFIFGLFTPSTTYAIPGLPQVTVTVGDIPGMIWRSIDKALKTVYSTTFRNQLSQFLNNLAYNTAVKLATGKSGQRPLFEVFDTRALINQVRDQAIGNFSEQLLRSTAGGGTCKVTGNAGINELIRPKKERNDKEIGGCVDDSQCPLIAKASAKALAACAGAEDGVGMAGKGTLNTEGNIDSEGVLCQTSVGPLFANRYFAFKGEDSSDFVMFAENGWIQPETLQRDTCVPKGGTVNFEGIDICRIQSPVVDIMVRTTGARLARFGVPPKPRCDFNTLRERFENIKQIDNENILRVRTMFNSGENDLSVTLNLGLTGIAKKEAEEQAKVLNILKNRGFVDKKDVVNDDKVKTQAIFLEKAAEESFFKTPFKQYLQQTGSLVADAFNAFTNTFASKMLDRLFNGLAPDDAGGGAGGGGKFDNSFFTKISGIAAARLKYADLLKVSDFRSAEKNSEVILQQFVAGCDAAQTAGINTTNPEDLIGIFNCVIDDGFKEAISRKLTIKEAVDEGLLSSSRIFGVRSDGSGSEALASESDLYSLRSILILRKYRIVPVGWELAARYIKDILQSSDRASKKSYTLGELLAAYYDPTSPFYKLVNPDFQLKIPVSVKETLMPSDRVITEIYVRNEDTNNDGKIDQKDEPARVVQRALDVVDTKGCIFENDDGSCRFYGYCVEENPFWDVQGEKCEPQYNTCQTFAKGNTKEQVSYLQNTLNTGVCDETNIGCRAYSRIQDRDGNWSSAENDFIYLDRTTGPCTSQEVGCREFIRLADYANNALSAGEINNIINTLVANGGESDDYNSYATFADYVYLGGNRLECSEEQVNCRLYTPVSNKTIPNIPGIITPAVRDADGNITAYNDECPAECVGYKSYVEMAYPVFGYDRRDVNLIADTAKTCPASFEGCTEFTVITPDGGEEVVYYSDVRICEPQDTTRPNRVYFTWEGDGETGFQLRSWTLVAAADGGPDQIGGVDLNVCNPDIYNLSPSDPGYNPDCREYTDANLNKYYRLHSKVIFVSEECQGIRRTFDGQIYNILPELSQECPAVYDGCRRYRPSMAGNNRLIINSTFEEGADEWSGDAAEISSESVSVGGHSLFVDSSLNPTSTPDIQRFVDIQRGKRYILEFWAKEEAGGISLSARIEGGNGSVLFDSPKTLSKEWDIYKMSVDIDFDPSDSDRIIISSANPGMYYIDNIRLYETDDIFLIKDSWDTPAICESPESQLNCEEYENDKGETLYLKDFTGICEEQYVGCEALIDTQGLDLVAGATIRGENIPQDEVVYYVNKPDYYCSAQSAGCSELGLRSVDRDGVESFETVYRILDPDFYEENICESAAEFCEEYIPQGSGGGFARYFKDPFGRVCEYRTGVIIRNEDGTYSDPVNGWFKTNITGEITPADVCRIDTEDVERVPICDPNSADQDNCWTYACPASQSSCAEFQDPVTPPGCDKNAPPGADNACNFYYLLKDSLTKGIQECGGVVSPSEGCVGLFDTSKGQDSKYLRADCQEGCPLIKQCYADGEYTQVECTSNSDCNSGEECRAVPVRELPSCQPDYTGSYPTSKPGCII